MQGSASADRPNDLHPGSFGKGSVDIYDFIALSNRQIDGLMCFPMQRMHEIERRFPHVQPAFNDIAEFQEAHAQPVCAWFSAINEALCDQVVLYPMRGRRMQAGYGGKLFQADRVRMLGK